MFYFCDIADPQKFWVKTLSTDPRLRTYVLHVQNGTEGNFIQKQWQAYTFSSMFILDVATKSQKDHKLFSATYILCSKKICI